MKTFAYIISYLIYLFSFLVPRNKSSLAFGSYRSGFSDNSKYLFLYLYRTHPELNIYWLSRNRQTIKHIRSLGLSAYWIYSPIGIWKALRAKYWFYNTYSSEIMFFLSGGATLINLWHGVGLKRCEFNINREGLLADRYVRRTFKERFYHPQAFQRPTYVLSSTNFQSEMFASAFRVSVEQCMNVGYPRNQILLKSKEEIRAFILRYEPKQTQQLVDILALYNLVYIYMPTWRDSQRDVFQVNIDLECISKILKEQNAVLLLKPHMMTVVDKLYNADNIILVDKDIDIYCVLPYTDVLITDYSSVLYDYLLIPDKQVILYLYDYTDYINMRDFYYPFDENVIGKRVETFNELAKTISTQDYKMNESDRQRILAKFWGKTMQKDVCENILKQIHAIP